jgi:DNA-binding response OmpR family regulator
VSGGEIPFKSVLLVEDEQALASTLKIALSRLGIPEIHWATTIDEARKLLAETDPELLILDRNLPDGDGLELCESLRAESWKGAIHFLTAKGEVGDRIAGLESGADDYLPKPFHWEELSARIRAVARRFEARERESKSAGPKRSGEGAKKAPLWTVESERLRIFGPKGWVELTPLEFKLATHLIRADGAIVSREELLKEVWGFRFLPKTRTTDYFLGRLRKAFEKDPDRPKHFITVRGAGYRFSSEPDASI